MTAQERRRPTRALQLARRLVPATIVLAVLLAASLAYAGHPIAALIFGVAPLTWLGAVTLQVYRVERRLGDFGTIPRGLRPRPDGSGGAEKPERLGEAVRSQDLEHPRLQP